VEGTGVSRGLSGAVLAIRWIRPDNCQC
jgi:hypothetical protein